MNARLSGFAVCLLLAGAAAAETPKGPVHISGHGASEDADSAQILAAEAREQAREALADAREDLRDSEKDLAENERELAKFEAGDFSRTLTIEDDKVVKCGDPARYPGCTPYTDAEKAQMLAEMRESLVGARAALEDAKRAIDAAERDLAALDAP